jgi:hypothetical protein
MVRRVSTLVLLSLVVLCACRSKVVELGATDDGGSGTSAPSSTPQTRQRITKDDCTKWAAHGVEATLADWKAATSRCSDDTKKTFADKIEGQRPTLESAAFTLCANKVGEPYDPGAAHCYMAGRTARALADCHFAPLTSPGDTDIAAEIERLRASCATPPAGSSTPM